MAIRRMSAADFVKGLEAALSRGDGYIMGATGQNPRNWAANSWWFTQYDGSASQKKKALYWREHAARVWDCNGLAEGLYKDFSGVDINTRARDNYASWCARRGKGLIPPEERVPGAAVFWGDSAAAIHHVAYLDRPVDAGKRGGDWYLIEARGVMYGVVKTRLLARAPQFWGRMDKYFDYDGAAEEGALSQGDRGDEVREVQRALAALGYDLGVWGADGVFGACTRQAVRDFQRDRGLTQTGTFGEAERAALFGGKVRVTGGQCWLRSLPDREEGAPLAVLPEGAEADYLNARSDDGWLKVRYRDKEGWISGKYGKVIA